jgi:hypothetical protein
VLREFVVISLIGFVILSMGLVVAQGSEPVFNSEDATTWYNDVDGLAEMGAEEKSATWGSASKFVRRFAVEKIMESEREDSLLKVKVEGFDSDELSWGEGLVIGNGEVEVDLRNLPLGVKGVEYKEGEGFEYNFTGGGSVKVGSGDLKLVDENGNSEVLEDEEDKRFYLLNEENGVLFKSPLPIGDKRSVSIDADGGVEFDGGEVKVRGRTYVKGSTGESSFVKVVDDNHLVAKNVDFSTLEVDLSIPGGENTDVLFSNKIVESEKYVRINKDGIGVRLNIDVKGDDIDLDFSKSDASELNKIVGDGKDIDIRFGEKLSMRIDGTDTDMSNRFKTGDIEGSFAVLNAQRDGQIFSVYKAGLDETDVMLNQFFDEVAAGELGDLEGMVEGGAVGGEGTYVTEGGWSGRVGVEDGEGVVVTPVEDGGDGVVVTPVEDGEPAEGDRPSVGNVGISKHDGKGYIRVSKITQKTPYSEIPSVELITGFDASYKYLPDDAIEDPKAFEEIVINQPKKIEMIGKLDPLKLDEIEKGPRGGGSTAGAVGKWAAGWVGVEFTAGTHPFSGKDIYDSLYHVNTGGNDPLVDGKMVVWIKERKMTQEQADSLKPIFASGLGYSEGSEGNGLEIGQGGRLFIENDRNIEGARIELWARPSGSRNYKKYKPIEITGETQLSAIRAFNKISLTDKIIPEKELIKAPFWYKEGERERPIDGLIYEFPNRAKCPECFK